MDTVARLEAKLDDIGKPAWIALTILGFIVWWPLGLAALFFLIWSGRMRCGQQGGTRWWPTANPMQQGGSYRWGPTGPYRSSGNWAFDEYRSETLKRLEDEQREFKEFLERLRHAKDKAEFDQFMAERGRRPTGPDTQPPPQG